jgi:hypothetical protein
MWTIVNFLGKAINTMLEIEIDIKKMKKTQFEKKEKLHTYC